ncbi:putative SOS response-associated peptidase YedK [Bradyrhizobium sp. LA2.1]
MCNLYSITTNQAAIAGLFRVVRRYEGNLPPMPGVFPDYPAPVIRDAGGGEREIVMMRWGHAATTEQARPARHQHPQHLVAALARMAQAGASLSRARQQFC